MGAGASAQHEPHAFCDAAYQADGAGMAAASLADAPSVAMDPAWDVDPASDMNLRTAEMVKPVQASIQRGASPPMMLFVPGSGALGIRLPEKFAGTANQFDANPVPRQPTPRPIARTGDCDDELTPRPVARTGACEDMFAGWEREDQHFRATQNATNTTDCDRVLYSSARN